MENYPERRARMTHREKSSRPLQLEPPPLRSLRHREMEKMKKSGFVKLPCRMIGNATGSEFQVYAYVASLSSFDKEGAYPSATTIARETGLSHNTVDVALRGLIERGFLQCERRGKKRYLSAPKNGVDDTPKNGAIDRLNIDRLNIDRGEREGKSPSPAHDDYPQSVEDVLKVAEDPRCDMKCTYEQAEKFFITRDTRNWVDACGRKIRPDKVYGDLKCWLLRDQSDTKKLRGAGETEDPFSQRAIDRRKALRDQSDTKRPRGAGEGDWRV